MVNLIIQAIIVLIVLGFLYWLWTMIRPILAQYVAAGFMQIIDFLILALVGAIIVFWFIIPLIRMVPNALKLSEMVMSLIT